MWFQAKKAVVEVKESSAAEKRQQVMTHLYAVQAGTLRFAAKKLEARSKTVQNLAITTILIEEADHFRSLADTLSPEGNNVRV
jgi:nitrogen-specific signal transduction histidine kinase